MKVLLLSTFDINGGAARAAYRLHKGLQQIGVESQMLVNSKIGDDPSVFTLSNQVVSRIMAHLDIGPLWLYRKRERVNWGLNWLPDRTVRHITRFAPDLIHLHWVSGGFISIEGIARLKCPVVWTLHDMWAFTGGCHYDQGCGRYVDSCGVCPQLKSGMNWDMSRWVWQRKKKAWQNLNLTIVAPSCWIADCAKSSSLFRNLHTLIIPNALDLERFKPYDKRMVREILNLPQEKKLIAFGAVSSIVDYRKGFQYLQPALQRLATEGWDEKAEVVILGASMPVQIPDLGLRAHYLGHLHDDVSLALVYAAADVFVAPSVQDNLPNTVTEALACGTPCVAFNVGGMPDIIDHEHNGYLACPFEVDDLARGIAWVLEDMERLQRLCRKAREKTTREFELSIVSKRHVNLYQYLLQQY